MAGITYFIVFFHLSYQSQNYLSDTLKKKKKSLLSYAVGTQQMHLISFGFVGEKIFLVVFK